MTSGRQRDEALARSRRRDRYRRRDLVWEVGENDRTRQCGRRTNGHVPDHAVQVLHGPHGAGFRGVTFCGSVWSCPVCSAVIRTKRAGELETGVRRHLQAGGALVFATFKTPHKRGESLRSVLDRVRGGLTAFKRNRAGRDLLAGIGVVGSVSALEVTHGRNGWHPHLHVLFFLDAVPSQDAVDHFRGAVNAEWVRYAERAGWPKLPGKDAAGVDQGVDVQLVRYERQAARYVAKVQGEDGRDHTPALELTRGDLKDGRTVKQLTPFQLLDGYETAVREKSKRAGRRWVSLWREYESTMHGRRCLIWSKGLRDRLRLGVELDDEEVANAIDHEGAEAIATIPREVWRIVVVKRQRAQLLEQAEKGGAAAVQAFLADLERHYWRTQWLEELE